MKNMKKLAVLLLALVMVVSMSTTALAANVVNETTHDYVAYQIFSGTQSIDSAQLGDVDWGTGIEPVGLVTALKEANSNLYKNVPALTADSSAEDKKAAAEAVIAALIADGDGADYHADADEFANIAVNYVDDENGVEIDADDTTKDLPAGYYLIVDVTEIVPDENGVEADANNPALLQVTNKGDILIAKKYNVPSIDKNIIHGDHTTKIDKHSIGDVVELELSAVMANNLEDYEVYPLTFHDAMSEGLTYNRDAKVYVDGVEVTTGFTVVIPEAEDKQHFGKECDLEIRFDDILTAPLGDDGQPAIKQSSNVVVKYTATLNEKAAVVDIPNTNEVTLEFANNPNWESKPGDETPPTGVTPWRGVEVYTTEVELLKTNGEGNPLTSAEFTLTGEKANVVIITKKEFVPWTEGDKYWLLDDGTYTTTDPSSDGINTDSYVNVEEVYMLQESSEVVKTRESVSAKAYVGADGKLKFTGLGPGVYTLVESKTPAGYNTIDPITLTITFNDNTKAWSYDWAWPGGHTFNSSATVTVVNMIGSVLPETGGMGTTLFYVGGGIMVAAAAILLISKKRKVEE